MSPKVFSVVLMILTLLSAQQMLMTSAATNEDAFQRVWSRHDLPVLDGEVERTWLWGPDERRMIMREPYQEAPNGVRDVLYYDKARMEFTHPETDADSIWYVTNGLLVVELVTGQMQVGDDAFETHTAAAVNVAGDVDDPDGPTYATFGSLLTALPATPGDTVTERVDRAGQVTSDVDLASRGVTIGFVDAVTNHAIAAPFWEFMNSSGLVHIDGEFVEERLFENAFFATGRPITEPYWATVRVGGMAQDVLMQCFERRCLTYTPENDPGWQVEAGNVGAHYYEWRYGELAEHYNYAGQISRPWIPEEPAGIEIAPDGTLFVIDGWRNLVLHYSASGELLDTWSEDTLMGTELNGFSPNGLDIDGQGNLYVADFGHDRILKLSPAGAVMQVLGAGRGAEIGQFDRPADVAVDAVGNIYVADAFNDRIQVFDADGTPLFRLGDGAGDAQGQFDNPRGVHVGPDGAIYVADTNNHRVQKFDSSGQFQTLYASSGRTSPHGIATAPDGRVYVALRFVSTVIELDAELLYQRSLPGEWNEPTYVTFDAATGALYVSDAGNESIVALDTAGEIDYSWPEAAFGLRDPAQIAFDSAGAAYVADEDAQAVLKFDAAGDRVDGWAIPLPYEPNYGLFVRDLQVGIDGQIYVLLRQRVLIASPDGTVVTQLAAGAEGSEDLGGASALAIDADGRIYVSYSGYLRNVRPEEHTSVGVSRFLADGQLDAHWNFGVPDRVGISYGSSIILEAERFYLDMGLGLSAFDLNGNLLDSWLAGVAAQLSRDAEGHIYLVRNPNSYAFSELPKIAKYDGDGVLLAEWDVLDDTGCSGSWLDDIAVSPSGAVHVITNTDDCVIVYEPAG